MTATCLVRKGTPPTLDVFGSTLELLSPPTEGAADCALRGTIPPGGCVPLHSHPDPEGFLDHDGLLVASPEYNSSVAAVLKNIVDRMPRTAPVQPPLVGFLGKVATLMSAWPGALGGLLGPLHLRSILGNMGVIALPDRISGAEAHEAFQPDGSLYSTRPIVAHFQTSETCGSSAFPFLACVLWTDCPSTDRSQP